MCEKNQFKVYDNGEPIYLDGLKCQFSVDDANSNAIAYVYEKEIADRIAQALNSSLLLEKTLADVQAGIPARDAEIEALRKENTELREQIEAVGAGGVNGKLMPGAVSAETVGLDQFRDAAQMIEPSGNSGELPHLPLNDPAAAYRVLHEYGQSCARAALAQQYGYKTAFEEWHRKTEFIQDWFNSNRLPVKYLGWHRADVLRDLVEQQDADKTDSEIDRAFNAVRKKLVALPRYSFLADGSGGVRCVKDTTGAWIPFDKANALFDPVSVDAARKEPDQ